MTGNGETSPLHQQPLPLVCAITFSYFIFLHNTYCHLSHYTFYLPLWPIHIFWLFCSLLYQDSPESAWNIVGPQLSSWIIWWENSGGLISKTSTGHIFIFKSAHWNWSILIIDEIPIIRILQVLFIFWVDALLWGQVFCFSLVPLYPSCGCIAKMSSESLQTTHLQSMSPSFRMGNQQSFFWIYFCSASPLNNRK